MKQEVPNFKEGSILRAKTLETLRDYAYLLPELSRKGYSDGVISGMELTSNGNCLEIGSGLFSAQSKIFFVDSTWRIQVEPCENVAILKLSYDLPVEIKNGQEYNFHLIIDEKENGTQGFELCRYRLQNGAKLRDRYVDFFDISTEYDTINLQSASYSGFRKPTLLPVVLWTFAEELLSFSGLSPLDQTFGLMILSSRESISFQSIQGYLTQKLSLEVTCLEEAYQGLLQVLRQAKDGITEVPTVKSPARPKILID